MNRKTSQSKLESIRTFLKRQMKSKKYSYRKMAKALAVSEITIKKWMTTRDFKLQNLIEIGNVLDIDFFDILKYDPSDLPDFRVYTSEEDEYFATHPVDWRLFIKVRHKNSLEKSRQQMGLTERELNQVLARLEKAGILEKWPNDRIKLKLKGPFALRPEGQMVKVLFSALRDHLFEHFKTHFPALTPRVDPEATKIFRSFQFHLTSESQKNYVQELMRVISKFMQIAESELSQNKSVHPVSSVLAVDQHDGWLHSLKKNY